MLLTIVAQETSERDHIKEVLRTAGVVFDALYEIAVHGKDGTTWCYRTVFFPQDISLPPGVRKFSDQGVEPLGKEWTE